MKKDNRKFSELWIWKLEDEVGIIEGKSRTVSDIFLGQINRVQEELKDINVNRAYDNYIKKKLKSDEKYSKIDFLKSKISELDHLEKTLIIATRIPLNKDQFIDVHQGNENIVLQISKLKTRILSKIETQLLKRKTKTHFTSKIKVEKIKKFYYQLIDKKCLEGELLDFIAIFGFGKLHEKIRWILPLTMFVYLIDQFESTKLIPSAEFSKRYSIASKCFIDKNGNALNPNLLSSTKRNYMKNNSNRPGNAKIIDKILKPFTTKP